MSSFIKVTQRGSFANIERLLARSRQTKIRSILEKYGSLGVTALSNATPVDSGLTSGSWYYEIIERPGYHSVVWHNRNVESGTSIAILLQYGHATRNGGYVQGRDYVNPAIQPVFDQLAADAWKEVSG